MKKTSIILLNITLNSIFIIYWWIIIFYRLFPIKLGKKCCLRTLIYGILWNTVLQIYACCEMWAALTWARSTWCSETATSSLTINGSCRVWLSILRIKNLNNRYIRSRECVYWYLLLIDPLYQKGLKIIMIYLNLFLTRLAKSRGESGAQSYTVAQ